jgi:hypothetical protein
VEVLLSQPNQFLECLDMELLAQIIYRKAILYPHPVLYSNYVICTVDCELLLLLAWRIQWNLRIMHYAVTSPELDFTQRL